MASLPSQSTYPQDAVDDLEPSTPRPSRQCLDETRSRHIRGRWNEGYLLRSRPRPVMTHSSQTIRVIMLSSLLTYAPLDRHSHSFARSGLSSICPATVCQRRYVETMRHHRPGDLLRVGAPWSVMNEQDGRLYTFAEIWKFGFLMGLWPFEPWFGSFCLAHLT